MGFIFSYLGKLHKSVGTALPIKNMRICLYICNSPIKIYSMIEKLKKSGTIDSGSSSLPLSKYSFDYVELDGEIVGVGYFENNSDICASAIIKNFNGKKEVLNELASKHPNGQPKEKLEELFDKKFGY